MVRRNQQKKREQRQADKAAEATLTSDQGSYIADRNSAQEKRFVQPLSDGALRIECIYWRRGGATVDFVFLLQQLDWEGWRNVSRVDCCHGHCHLHTVDDAPATTSLVKLDSEDDVKIAFVEAQEVIRDVAHKYMGERNDSDEQR